MNIITTEKIMFLEITPVRCPPVHSFSNKDQKMTTSSRPIHIMLDQQNKFSE